MNGRKHFVSIKTIADFHLVEFMRCPQKFYRRPWGSNSKIQLVTDGSTYGESSNSGFLSTLFERSIIKKSA